MPSITKLPDSTVPRSEKDLLYSTLLALGGEGGGITRLPQSETPRSEQDLLYSIMLAAQSISSGGGMDASSQSQAETGANNDTAMTPLRVAQKLAFDLGAPTTIGKSILNLANPEAITFLRMNTNNTASALSASDMRTALGLESVSPIILSVKNVTVLTSGAPADIASITLPSWLTRWSIPLGSIGNFTSRIIAETASGTLAGASFTCYTAASGGGSAVTANIFGPSAAALGGVINGITPATAAAFTSNTIYIRQTANSANAGTVSFYLMLLPFL